LRTGRCDSQAARTNTAKAEPSTITEDFFISEIGVNKPWQTLGFNPNLASAFERSLSNAAAKDSWLLNPMNAVAAFYQELPLMDDP
jgi:DNA phosphorothioation-dependent restriction protein DptG